jgi:predicted flap endonuclease-1-like 5' DNA nuclease
LTAVQVFNFQFGDLNDCITSAMNYPLKHIDGMTPVLEVKLKSKHIRTTEKLLEAASTVKGRKELAASTGIAEQQWLDWANNADCMRIKGMGSEKAKLLRRAGVTTVGELSHRNPRKLAEAMAEANTEYRLMRVQPSEKSVRALIEQAKRLPRKITY